MPAICQDDVNSLAIPAGKTLATIECDGGDPADVHLGDPVVPAAYCLAGAAPQVSRVELRLSDGSMHEIKPVVVGHTGYLAFLVSNANLVQWTAFDAAGHQLGTGSGKSL
jgi:hypothetical protein